MCRILLCDEYGLINLISLLLWEQSRLTPVCMCATARVGAHTGRKWVRGRLVGGDRARRVCHSWAVPSGLLSEWVCVHAWCFPYQHLSHKSRRVRPTFSSVNSNVREWSFVYLAQIVEFVSCDVNVFDKLSSCISSNRMHSRSEWCQAAQDSLEFIKVWPTFVLARFFRATLFSFGKVEHCAF